MQSSERGIDHIVLVVKDLEAARRRFAALGFTCTPPAVHPFGTGNSLLQFSNSFVEMVTVVDPAKLVPMSAGHYSFSGKTAQFLEERGDGMAMLVMSSQDARADSAAWAEHGLKTYEAVDFSRQAGQPGGGSALVAFTIAFAVDPTMPEIAFFVCQQHKPENFWQPAYQAHANGVTDIVGVTLSAPRPESHRDFFAAYIPEAEIEAESGRLIVEAPRGRIEVLRPDAVEARFGPDEVPATGDVPSFVAMTLAVKDLEALGESFTAAHIDHRHLGSRILLPAQDCFGLAIEFLEL